jgi:hypothetical protein
MYRYDYLLTGGSRRRGNHQQEEGGGGCDSYLLSFQPNMTRIELLHLSQRRAFRKWQVAQLKASLSVCGHGVTCIKE